MKRTQAKTGGLHATCVAVALLSVALGGCDDETSLLVVIDADESVRDHIDALAVLVEVDGAVAFDRTLVLAADATLPESVDFRPGPYDDELVSISVRGLEGSAGGEELAYGMVTSQFSPGEQRRVAVSISPSCVDGCDGWAPCFRDLCVPRPCSDAAECDDGRYCNGVERCDGTACGPGDSVACPPDDVECTVEVCDESTRGCVHELHDEWCEMAGWVCDVEFDCSPV